MLKRRPVFIEIFLLACTALNIVSTIPRIYCVSHFLRCVSSKRLSKKSCLHRQTSVFDCFRWAVLRWQFKKIQFYKFAAKYIPTQANISEDLFLQINSYHRSFDLNVLKQSALKINWARNFISANLDTNQSLPKKTLLTLMSEHCHYARQEIKNAFFKFYRRTGLDTLTSLLGGSPQWKNFSWATSVIVTSDEPYSGENSRAKNESGQKAFLKSFKYRNSTSDKTTISSLTRFDIILPSTANLFCIIFGVNLNRKDMTKKLHTSESSKKIYVKFQIFIGVTILVESTRQIKVKLFTDTFNAVSSCYVDFRKYARLCLWHFDIEVTNCRR